jgi:hypothetical protein
LNSDHGRQYTSEQFRVACEHLGIVQSMGSVGDSYDNAMAESFWSSLKRELVDDAHFHTKEEARRAIFEWIIWYNTERLHSSLDYKSPQEFEASFIYSTCSVIRCPSYAGNPTDLFYIIQEGPGHDDWLRKDMRRKWAAPEDCMAGAGPLPRNADKHEPKTTPELGSYPASLALSRVAVRSSVGGKSSQHW